MSNLAVPGASAVSRRPLSTHGLPKAPRVMSPELPHRFEGHGHPSQTIISTISPRSPGPMSPPMSARSIGTFIDSEPSTPAYSPRMDHDWDSSTLVLLRPLSSSSEPASPSEPVWDMVVPPKKPQQTSDLYAAAPREKQHSIVTREMSIGTRLAAPPVKKIKSARKVKASKEVTIVDPYPQESEQPHNNAIYEVKPAQGDANENNAAPFGKLASKMKLMLRRRSTGDKKKEKKEKEKDYYDPVEDVHWTEM